MSTALATGGTGFIAIYVVKLLLERGSSMHTTVRRLDDRAKCQPLLALQAEYPWKLEIFQADLLKDGSFNQAMQGCELVYHVASPLLVPAVLESTNRIKTVKRVVLISSIAATYSDSADILAYKDATLSKAYWNETSTAAYDPYKYSKVAAEREAWKMKNAQSRWDMVVINPGLVIGPSLPPQSASGSLHMLQGMYHGENKSGVPELHYPIADVRDVAEAHIRVGTSRSAKGRYIVASDSSALHGLIHEMGGKENGIDYKVDNSRSIKELGIDYRPKEETMRDH
ncbi:hypothetical protein MBLNU13_g08056t1 [Cladosporium sp. NU13]